MIPAPQLDVIGQVADRGDDLWPEAADPPASADPKRWRRPQFACFDQPAQPSPSAARPALTALRRDSCNLTKPEQPPLNDPTVHRLLV
jgi:hypothetical protein